MLIRKSFSIIWKLLWHRIL